MKRTVSLVVVGIQATLGVGCEGPMAGSGPTDPPDSEVREAVVRELMTGFSSAEGLIHCIRFRVPEPVSPEGRHEDPSPGFLGRFDPATEVAPGSTCGFDDLRAPVRHRPTGREAVLYTIGVPVRSGEASVEITGRWSRASLVGASCRYDLALEGGAWVVKDIRDCIEN